MKEIKVGTFAYIKGNMTYTAYKGRIIKIILIDEYNNPFPYLGRIILPKDEWDICYFGRDELRVISEKEVLARMI